MENDNNIISIIKIKNVSEIKIFENKILYKYNNLVYEYFKIYEKNIGSFRDSINKNFVFYIQNNSNIIVNIENEYYRLIKNEKKIVGLYNLVYENNKNLEIDNKIKTKYYITDLIINENFSPIARDALACILIDFYQNKLEYFRNNITSLNYGNKLYKEFIIFSSKYYTKYPFKANIENGKEIYEIQEEEYKIDDQYNSIKEQFEMLNNIEINKKTKRIEIIGILIAIIPIFKELLLFILNVIK